MGCTQCRTNLFFFITLLKMLASLTNAFKSTQPSNFQNSKYRKLDSVFVVSFIKNARKERGVARSKYQLFHFFLRRYTLLHGWLEDIVPPSRRSLGKLAGMLSRGATYVAHLGGEDTHHGQCLGTTFIRTPSAAAFGVLALSSGGR